MQTLINGIATQHLSVHDRGFQYGDGLFETIKCSDRKLCFWTQHYARLQSSAEVLAIPCPTEQTLLDDITALLDNRPDSSEINVIKIILTRGNSDRGYTVKNNQQPNRIVQLSDASRYNKSYYRDGIKATFCTHRTSANAQLAGIKHLNRLDNVLARHNLGKQYQEGIMLNQQDDIIEGTMSNIFIVKNGATYTPELTDSGVAGIIRQQLLDITSTNITSLNKQDVLDADEVFFSNSLIGIWPVQQLDETRYTTQHVQHTLQQFRQHELQHATSI